MMLHYGINYQKRLLIYLLAGGFLPLLVVSAVILYAADHMYEAMQEQGRTCRGAADLCRDRPSYAALSADD